MLKNKERMIREKTDEIAVQVKNYIDEMDNLSETNEFTISNIEAKWGLLEEFTKQVYREINNEIIKNFSEKEIIKSKKVNMLGKG